jgi:hypothetical protein
MKTYSAALLILLLTASFLLAGCSKEAEKGSPPEATVSPEPPSSAPAEKPPGMTPPPTAIPAPAAVPAGSGKAEAKTKPAAPKAAQQTTAAPAVKPPAVAPAAPVAQAPKTQRVTLPVGTLIPVRIIDSVDSRTDQVGQTFRASVDADVALENQTVVPKGANATLKLTRVSSAGELRGKSELQLELDRIAIGTASYDVTSNVVERAAKAEGPKTARDIGIGAGIGAAIGAIAGGKKGAAIGAGVGAGSGAAVAAITKGEQVLVPSETRLEFRLEQPVEIVVTQAATD